MTAEYIATEKPDHTFNLISQPLKTTPKIDRKVIIKCQAQYYQLLTKVLNDIKAFKPLLS
jgi:flagellar biosynthesis/type III secretory pathway protein FliH